VKPERNLSSHEDRAPDSAHRSSERTDAGLIHPPLPDEKSLRRRAIRSFCLTLILSAGLAAAAVFVLCRP
jgi:hypothetical protein